MESKINILFLIPSLAIAGAEKVCCNICDNLDFEVFDVTLISLSSNIPLWATLQNKDRLKFYTCNEPHKNVFPWFSIKVYRNFFNIIRTIKPEIVHSHLWGIKCLYLIGFLFIKHKPIFISTIHSSEFIYTSRKISSKLFKNIENVIYKFLRFNLISISSTVDMMVRKKLNYKTLTIIENGIDTDLFKPNMRFNYKHIKQDFYKNNYPILINVGRASEHKRQIDIINAVYILKNEYPKIKLLLVGRDNNLFYHEKVKEMNLEANIDFIQANNEVIKYLSIADICVFPSLFEGLSLALAEMMSCGLPIVISNIPSLTQMTNNDEAALVVPLKNPEAIANNVKIYLEDNKLAILKGNNARKIALERFSIHTMIKKHTDLYKSFFT